MGAGAGVGTGAGEARVVGWGVPSFRRLFGPVGLGGDGGVGWGVSGWVTVFPRDLE